MRFFFKTLMSLFVFLWPLISMATQAQSGYGVVGEQEKYNVLIVGLFGLIFVMFAIMGVIGYLWYRKSKYKKKKVILNV